MVVPRVRFTVRWLMAMVAVVAMLLGAEVTLRRWVVLASMYRTQAIRCERQAYMAIHGRQREATQGNDPEARKLGRIADHYAELVRKYEHAARYPWLSIPSDPPEPR